MRRRVDLLHEEGIEFVTNTHVGKDVDVQDLRANWCVGLYHIIFRIPGLFHLPPSVALGLRALSALVLFLSTVY